MANIAGKFMVQFSVAFFLSFRSVKLALARSREEKTIFFRRVAVFISRVKRNVHKTPIPPLTDYKFYFMHIF